MNLYFADTSYYMALLVPQDRSHADADRFADDPEIHAVTSEFVLLELSAFFAKPPLRKHVIHLVSRLRQADNITIVAADPELFRRGWDLYQTHADKSWSLTDCISFVIMRDREIALALTADHHFEQAGFNVLLKEPGS